MYFNIKDIFLINVFFIILITSNNLFANYDSLANVQNMLIAKRDSISNVISKEKKQEKSQKIESTFKFISYLNYVDRGDGIKLFGAEKYQTFAGKKINQIFIKVEEPFSCDSCTLKKAQKFANKIHLSTKEWQAKQDLLFEAGDILSPSVMADAERLLWERNRYKYVNISVSPACDDELREVDDKVDVYIYLVDRLSYTMATGYSNESLLITGSINNLFKQPNSLYLSTFFNFNKNNLFILSTKYIYRNILNSKIDFNAAYTYSNLTQKFSTSLSKAYLSVITKWAFNASYTYSNQKVSLTNNLRDINSLVKAKSHAYNLWLSYAQSLSKISNVRTDRLKFIISTKINHIKYKERPFIIDKNVNTNFINISDFIFGFGFAFWDYYVFNNIYYIDQPEFLPKKWNLSFWIGPQIDELLGRRNNFSMNLNYGKEFKKFGYLYSEVNYGGYIRNKKGEQMLLTVVQNYIAKSIKIRKHTHFRTLLGAKFNYGFFYPEDRYFTINNAIRSFYSPSLKGSKSITANIEANFFLDKRVALSKGMVYAFADIGWISNNDKKLITQSFFQYGVGLGMRIRSLDLGLPYIDLQFAFYPKGKQADVNPYQFRLYEQNLNTILTNSLFFQNPRTPNFITQ